MGMRESRPGQGNDPYYLVLNRSCADLYEEIAEAFEDRPYIEVVVDRRRGKAGMKEIPAKRRRGSRRWKGQVNLRLLSVRVRQEAS